MRTSLSRLVALLGLVFALTGCVGTTAAWTVAPSSARAGGAAAAPSTPTATPAANPGASAAPAMNMMSQPPAVAAGTGTIAIDAFDLGFKPNAVSVPAAGSYAVTFHNTGAIQHDLTFADGTKIAADPGATVSGTVTIPAGGLAFICSIPGHADAGMKGQVSVSGQAVAPGASAPANTDTASAPVADPNAPPYVLRNATAPAVLAGSVHDIDMPIIDRDITVATGFVVHAWTFGGTVPGPTIRVHLGDTVNVHLTNDTTMSHSIDFHASQTAMNDQMIEIKPGASFTYTFRADYAGVWMYHCGTAPALDHIANGMFGMVIVEPRGGLLPVDQEVAFVQSEWYLGGQGQPVDFNKAAAGNPAPDFVVFNGIANQYKDNPIQVTTNGRVRVFVLDAGPNIDSSFHVVGTIFDSVIKEGVVLAPGNAQGWGSQAVDLSPAQAAIIEFSPKEDGMYPLVTHAFNFVGRGAMGFFMAGDGDPKN